MDDSKDKSREIARVIAGLDPAGTLADLAEARGGALAPGEALEAVRELVASGSADAVREAFLGWDEARQSEAIGALAGDDPAMRRTWSRLIFGIAEGPDGAPELA